MKFFGFLTTAALEIRADGTYTPFSTDAWTYAGQMTLLGMVMVFAVLAILWCVLAIFKLIFAGKSPKEVKQEKAPAHKKAEEKAVQPNDAELMAVLSAAVAAHQNSDEMIAVLTAAVSAYRAQEGETSGFRVVAFKRATGRAWNTK